MKKTNQHALVSQSFDFHVCGHQPQVHWFLLKMQFFKNNSQIYIGPHLSAGAGREALVNWYFPAAQ